jgi:hypothetical protein
MVILDYCSKIEKNAKHFHTYHGVLGLQFDSFEKKNKEKRHGTKTFCKV